MHDFNYLLIILVIATISVIVPRAIGNRNEKRYKEKALDKFDIYYHQYLKDGFLSCRNLFTNLQLNNETVKISKWRFNLNDIQDVKFGLYTNTIDFTTPHTYISVYIKTNYEEKRIHLQKNNLSSTICFLLVLKFRLTSRTEYNKKDIELLLLDCEKSSTK